MENQGWRIDRTVFGVAAVGAALADSHVRKRYGELGQELPAPGQHTAEALRKFHKAEVDKLGPIIKAANIQPN